MKNLLLNVSHYKYFFFPRVNRDLPRVKSWLQADEPAVFFLTHLCVKPVPCADHIIQKHLFLQ